MNKTQLINRRSFLGSSAMAGVAAGIAAPTGIATAGDPEPKKMGIPLREKFFGCIAGCHIGSSMGAAVEGWPWSRIEEQYGTLDRLLPYHHYQNLNNWVREPGTTEDGVERQKLMITAILEKGGRVTAEDVRRIWVRDIKPESIGYVSEPFEAELLAMAKSQIPAAEIGRYCDYAGLVSMARSCHPIGLINAGDVENAIADVYEAGRLYQSPNSRGIQWAAVTAAAIAAATKPGATVDSVIGTILDQCHPPRGWHVRDAGVAAEIGRALQATESCADFRELRAAFDALYGGYGIAYAQSYANEVVSKAVCVFRMVKGITQDAIIASVNMGRDTDCLASVAAGIAGALSGGESIRGDLIQQVDSATRLNRYTNSQRTLRETADGLYGAFQAKLVRMKAYTGEMEGA